MSDIRVGDLVIETTPRGRVVKHTVTALDQPPDNPAADPGPYVEMTDPMRGRLLKMRPQDIEEADWLELEVRRP